MKRVLLSWSSGKDSAWALHVLRQQPGIELVPAIREGGARGMPVALAGPKSSQAAEFYAVAEKLMERAEAAGAAATDVIEIS